ncbi:hypothetical protein [Aquamicrobium defluvii]|uniref:Membrane protein n=1 Tax=Aquamicrobium defluvii TaxID=69279 RepID=A0A011UV26_9HYPH|nr:hypothetical protein [Aquamicrobium defluvii]EXL09748.1 membrane protein [Aquamicrobium defluvii]EZQ16553.1 membrane protein [Halopseudomonas bauzanensis]TDR37982.1 hypothetical protein DES43_10146 [Aquamicrobium defluvii]
MDDNFDKAGIAVIIVFGALCLGGLMAANLVAGDRNGFLLALAGSLTAYIAGYAVLFDLPRVYAILIAIALIFGIASTIAYAF